MENELQQFAADPLAFLAELIIPSVHGPRRFGDCMADFQRLRFESLAPALLAIARGEKPPIGRHFWEATKGASKDSDLACCLLWLLAFTTRPLTCQVGAADADQADELRKAAKDILRLNPWLQPRIGIQNWRIVCEATGATCEIVAADIAGSHGARPDVLIINELSHVAKQEFAENLMDNAAKVPHGLVVIATNAGFLDTWQYRWRELARESDRWSFHQLAEPAPWLDPAELAEVRIRNSTSRYMRLFYGTWSAQTGDALDAESIALAFSTNHQPMLGNEPDMGFLAAADLSTRRDRSAFCVLAFHWPTQRIKLAHLQTWTPGVDGKVNLQTIELHIVECAGRFNFGQNGLFIDPWQAELMSQRLIDCGINVVPVPFSAPNLNKMASSLLQVFRECKIDLYEHAELRRDLGKLCIVDRGFGAYKLVAPRDSTGHADAAVALSIALPFAAEAAMTYQEPIDTSALPQSIGDFSSAQDDMLRSYGLSW